jgi:hypothetical protein
MDTEKNQDPGGYNPSEGLDSNLKFQSADPGLSDTMSSKVQGANN